MNHFIFIYFFDIGSDHCCSKSLEIVLSSLDIDFFSMTIISFCNNTSAKRNQSKIGRLNAQHRQVLRFFLNIIVSL